jgi:natural product biosynthesis luciferase-like monooxygenase protein
MKTDSRWHPLSYGQQALWFLQQLSPRSTAYNFVFAARILSPVDVRAFRHAFQALTERHASLRTTYSIRGGKPAQQIHGHVDLPFEILDATAWSPEQLKNRLNAEAYRPFDLERGPIMRLSLFTCSPKEHLFLLAAHHIAIDFWSLLILLDELGELYRAVNAGGTPSLPPLRLQYSDYVRWQQQLLAGAEGERLLAYWRGQLAGELPALKLPLDRPRPPLQTFHGASYTLRLDVRLTSRLKTLSRSHDTTLLTILLAAFQLLLHCESGQDDLLVGWPATGRRPEFERVVGYMVNPVAVRADLSGDPSFTTFLRRVGAAVANAWEHQDYSFPLLVERLQPVRDPSRSPLFQTLFAFYTPEEQELLPLLFGESGVQLNVGGLQLEAFAVDQQAAMLDLSLIMVEVSESLTAYLQYNTDLFDAATIGRIASRFQILLEAIAADPAQRLSDLRSQTPAGRIPWPVTPVAAGRASAAPAVPARGAGRRPEFSLFYFASDERASARNKYRLLIEGAKFADRHGFSAVWTPERHFHAFGGLYPNPSVTSAALAALTERIQIRAGSVVLPLHHPVRVAEEWSVVDNLSDGRVGISFASGWNANDFIFAPENYARRREMMVGEIELVRRLWRGEALSFPASDGRMVDLTIWPRPIQPELPVWVSAFGSPETFRVAGQLGAGILTHLVGQSPAELARKIRIYWDARRQHGFDPQGGSVAVMLHTFIGEDLDAVRETVRGPFLAYLKSSVDLARMLAQSTGIGVDPSEYTEAEVDAYLRATFDRYFRSSALFGTPTSCDALISSLLDAGVDEIACLIDFGIDGDKVLSGLNYLNLVRERAQAGSAARPQVAPPDPHPQIDTPSAAPQDATERAIAAIWTEVLGLEGVDIHDSFYDLGGEPALLAQVQQRLREVFDRDLSLTELSSFPTISAWAKLVRQPRSAAASLQPLQGRVEARRNAIKRQQLARQSNRAGASNREAEHE